MSTLYKNILRINDFYTIGVGSPTRSLMYSEVAQLITSGNPDINPIPKSLNSDIWGSYGDALFNRVHFLPASGDFGLIQSDQFIEFELWNANKTDVTVSNVNLPSGLGLYFQTNQIGTVIERYYSKNIQLWAESDGIQMISGDVIFDFNNGESIGFYATGTREIVTFHYRPVSGYEETYSFFIDEIRSLDGSESRISVIDNPKMNLKYKYISERKDCQNIEGIIEKKMGGTLLVPQWHSSKTLNQDINVGDTVVYFDTEGMNLQVGQYILIRSGDSQFNVLVNEVFSDRIVTSFDIQNSASSGADVAPLFMCVFDSASKEDYNTSLSSYTISFDNYDYELNVMIDNSAVYEEYRGSVLLFNQPDKSDPIRTDYGRDTIKKKTSYGPLAIFDRNDQNYNSFNYEFTLLNVKEIEDFKSLLLKIRGNQKSFWIPTFKEDITLIKDKDFDSLIDYIEINNISYQKNFLKNNRDIIIFYKDGTHSCYSVTNAIDSPDLNGSERLQLDRNLDKLTNYGNIDYVSFLNKARFASHKTNFKYITQGVAKVSKQIQILKHE